MEKRVFALLVILIGMCCFSFSVYSQILPNGTGSAYEKEIYGCVYDTTGNATVPYAHLFFIHGTDTTKLTSSLYGNFTYKGQIVDGMRIRVTSVGYKPFEEEYILHKHGLNIKILLQPESVMLNEIIITGKMVAMVVKGDTLQYNAEAFTALEGDFMDVLLKKMPGVQYTGGGLTVNGQPISRVYVNGNNALFNGVEAVKHIEADNVKDIKVYDEKKKDSRKLGLKHEEKETVMDVTTKRKVSSVNKTAITFGVGRDISQSQTDLFQEKYDMAFEHTRYIPGKNINISAKYSNAPASGGPSANQKVYGGYFDYRFNKPNFNYNTKNTYNNQTTYSNSSIIQNYFPTEWYDSRSYASTTFRKNNNYYYETLHQGNINGSAGWLSFMGRYRYIGKKQGFTESSESLEDNDLIANVNIDDYQKTHSSALDLNLNYANRFSKTKTSLDVTGGYNLNNENGDGWRIDTLDTSTSQMYWDKQRDNKSEAWQLGVNVSQTLHPLWNLNIGVATSRSVQEFDWMTIDQLTATIDSINTRNYRNREDSKGGGVTLSYHRGKFTYSLSFNIRDLHRERIERFPLEEVIKKHFFTNNSNFKVSGKLSPTFNMKATIATGYVIPAIEKYRAFIDNDLNPLILSAGNPNLKLPKKHSFNFEMNQMFIKNASSFQFKASLEMQEDYVANNSRYFTEETYLAEYDYTFLRGSVLNTVENADNYYRLFADLLYMKLSNLLKSNVIIKAEYCYNEIPAFSQGLKNNLIMNEGYISVNLTTNFSRKVEFVFGSGTRLSRSESQQRSGSNILSEKVGFSVRTTVIPRFNISTRLDHSYTKQYDAHAKDINETIWNISVSRNLGKSMTLSLNGYNLLDVQDSQRLSKTAEYFSKTETNQTGRYVMLTLKYNFK